MSKTLDEAIDEALANGQDPYLVGIGFKRKAAMTDPNKAAVLAKWPGAYCFVFANSIAVVYKQLIPFTSQNSEGPELVIGQGKSEPEAWADAARRPK